MAYWGSALVTFLLCVLGGTGFFSPAEAAADAVRSNYAKEFAESAATAILVEKSKHRLTVFHEGKELKTYPCAFGVNPDGDKKERGDNRTPEGRFFVTEKERLGSHPYLGRSWLGLSYPDVGHAERGLGDQLISYGEYQRIVTANEQLALPPQDTQLGGWIGIHGGRDEATREGRDWTEGCIAMRNADMREVWNLVQDGTLIEIRP